LESGSSLIYINLKKTSIKVIYCNELRKSKKDDWKLKKLPVRELYCPEGDLNPQAGKGTRT
jgi:hypothetical protein